jgi:hypothetical protein
MTTSMLGLAVAAVRVWTRLYTCCLAPEVRTRRRAEIASDLWESQQDPSVRVPALAMQILLRLLRGAPHDLRWRIEQIDPPGIRPRTVGLAAIAVVAAWWALGSAPPRRSPRPPSMQIVIGAPHPPPPPEHVDQTQPGRMK